MNFRLNLASIRLAALLISPLAFSASAAETSSADRDAQLLKAASGQAGKVSSSEKRLYEDSIQTTKESIAKDTLDVFYRDAVELYRQRRYDEALLQLDHIRSVDPDNDDVERLRQAILKVKTNREASDKGSTIRGFMRKGNEAMAGGQSVLAISFWKQALEADPNFEPAKKKIDEVNKGLGRKQFEAGYIHYHHGELEDALDAWSNAIALDPSLKNQGLLLLMSRVELGLKRDKITKLAAQAYEQFTVKDLEGALASYEEVLKVDARHEEARRMSGKIKIQLGQAAFQSAQQKMANKQYADAVKDWQASIKYGWEVPRAEKGLKDAETAMKPAPVVASKPKATKPKPATGQASSAASSAPPALPAAPANPEEAMEHYRNGLGAIRSKDYHRAVDELKVANAMDPANERIYMALTRAQQEWNNVNQGRTQ